MAVNSIFVNPTQNLKIWLYEYQLWSLLTYSIFAAEFLELLPAAHFHYPSEAPLHQRGGMAPSSGAASPRLPALIPWADLGDLPTPSLLYLSLVSENAAP
jgi:hypothetical protein